MVESNRHVIVIGSGPTGVISALTFVKAGIPVVMLEASQHKPKGLHIRAMGKDILTPEPLPLERFAYPEFINSSDCRARWLQGLTVGGLSNFWGGVVLRFAPSDFTNGQYVHEKFKWPITYDEILPYYERIEKLIYVYGSKSSFEVLPACHLAKEIKLPRDWQDLATAAGSLGHSVISLPKASGPRWLLDNAASNFGVGARLLKKLLRSPLFRLITGARVLKVDWNSHKLNIDKVLYYDENSKQEKSLPAQAVVLAAGALSSTQILLNSSCPDFPEGLGNINGLLGRYLHDNPLECVSIEVDAKLELLQRGLYMTRSPYKDAQPLKAVGYQIYGGTSHLANARKAIRIVDKNQSNSDCLLNFFCFGTIVPKVENSITLSNKFKDKYGLPLPKLNISFEEEDCENMSFGKKKIVEILNLAKYKFSVLSSSTEPPGVSVHYGGTVRMHESQEYGLLNAWNQMYAVRNLVVVDASCFTTSVEKNPTLTAMALSLRATEKLISILKEQEI